MNEENKSALIDVLTPERKRLLRVMQNSEYSSITDLCKDAKVNRQTYYNAIQDKNFVEALFADSNGLIYASIPQIITRIIRQAKAGSFVHQKMLLEMVKLYQGVPQNQTNIQNSVVFGWKS